MAMTVQEAKKAFDELKAQGNSEDDILGVLYTMFQSDAITFEELESFAKILGYEITDEFRNMSPEDQKTKGYEQTDDVEGGAAATSKEEIEDAKEIDEDEIDNESEDKDEDKDGDDIEDEDEGEDEDEKAAKLFGFDNNKK